MVMGAGFSLSFLSKHKKLYMHVLDSVSSTPLLVTSGVPWELVLGPLSYIHYPYYEPQPWCHDK